MVDGENMRRFESVMKDIWGSNERKICDIKSE
jgi:hypothetical protein